MSQRAPSCPSGSNYLPNLNDAFVMIINKHLLKVSMCDIPEGLKDWDADSRDSAPVGGGAGKQMVGGRGEVISASLGRAKMERGQHLRPRQKQNKPGGREQLRACRPSKRGSSCLKTSRVPQPPPTRASHGS